MDTFNLNVNFENNLPFILFIFVYFGFQIFSQIWGKFINTGIPGTRNYIQNFISALVLIVLVIYFAKPKLLINKYSTIFFIVTFIFVFIFCYAKKGIDDMSEKDKQMKKDVGMKGITVIMMFLFGGLGLAYFIIAMRQAGTRSDYFKIFGSGILIVSLIGSFYGFKSDRDDQNNLVPALYLYPLLFLTKGMSESRFMSYSYLILYTTVIALWGFFGVEWFTGKKEYDGINEQVCKAYLGLSDDDMASPIGKLTQTRINTKNINFIFIVVALIFVSFIIALIFVFMIVQKITV